MTVRGRESTKTAYWDPDNTMGFTASPLDLCLQADFLEAPLLKIYGALISMGIINLNHSILIPGH